MARASAPGKVILLGEHFVVEGCPAVALAIDVRACVTATLHGGDYVEVASQELGSVKFEGEREGGPLYPVYLAAKKVIELTGTRAGLRIKVESDIPPAAGMGSSAAVAVATVAAVAGAVGAAVSLDEISELAYKVEEVVHERPSGIDNTVATYGGVILFRRGQGFTKLDVKLEPVRVVLADSGVPRSTGSLVVKVLKLKAKYSGVLNSLYQSASALVEEAVHALQRGDFETVGELVNINHGLLSSLGVSCLRLEELIYTAREAGALGAKITGAGGGGMILALCWKDNVEEVVRALERVATRVITAPVSARGVAWET